MATARAGCLVAGCCHGARIPDATLGLVRYPTQAFEIAGFVLLHLTVRRTAQPAAAAVVLIGFGLIRWVVEPLRAPPPLGEGVLPTWSLAAAWVATGLGFALHSSASAASRLADSRARSELPQTDVCSGPSGPAGPENPI